jgi:hypothetical protein
MKHRINVISMKHKDSLFDFTAELSLSRSSFAFVKELMTAGVDDCTFCIS